MVVENGSKEMSAHFPAVRNATIESQQNNKGGTN
jgi:hypothetical protein